MMPNFPSSVDDTKINGEPEKRLGLCQKKNNKILTRYIQKSKAILGRKKTLRK
jgi:hypothetical protein